MVKEISSESTNLSYRAYSDESYLETDMGLAERLGRDGRGAFCTVLDPIRQTPTLYEGMIAFDALSANCTGGILSAEWIRVLLCA